MPKGRKYVTCILAEGPQSYACPTCTRCPGVEGPADGYLVKTVDRSLLSGGAMQLVAAASEPKFVAGAGAGGTQEPKFAPFPLALSTTSSHETHQQKGEICGIYAA